MTVVMVTMVVMMTVVIVTMVVMMTVVMGDSSDFVADDDVCKLAEHSASIWKSGSQG